MRKISIYGLVFLFLVSFVAAESCNVYFFYSDTCPHCAKEKVFLEEFQEEYPDININWLEVSANYETFEEVSENLGTIAVGVPRTYINGTVFVGFTEESGELEYITTYKAYNGYENQIKKSLLDHYAKEHNISVNDTCEPVDGLTDKSHWIFPVVVVLAYLLFLIVFRKKVEKRYLIGAGLGALIVSLFYLSQHLPAGEIMKFAKSFSFPVFTFIIALLDGFNPCAFAVLAVLLSLLVYAQSKKKMALIGVIFILTSSIMYFLFIVVLLTLRAELLGEYKGMIRIVVGLIALIAGLINVKDFFFFKKGVSLTISQSRMSKIIGKMRGVVNEVREAKTARAMFLAVLGTIVLAAFVNLVELGCTLILPVQYIEVLITNFGTNLSPLHFTYIAFYCLVYIIPLLFILGSFLYTFKSERMTEDKGKIMKLIGGIVMIGLGLILLLKPELLVFG